MNRGAWAAVVACLLSCKNSEAPSPPPAGGSSQPSITSPQQPSLRDAKPEGTVEAVALAAEFKNEVRGAQLYGGKVYDIRGVLARVINENNDPYLMLHGTAMDVSCHFDAGELSAVAQLEPNTTITVRGLITGKANGVVVFVQPCIVVPAAP